MPSTVSCTGPNSPTGARLRNRVPKLSSPRRRRLHSLRRSYCPLPIHRLLRHLPLTWRSISIRPARRPLQPPVSRLAAATLAERKWWISIRPTLSVLTRSTASAGARRSPRTRPNGKCTNAVSASLFSTLSLAAYAASAPFDPLSFSLSYHRALLFLFKTPSTVCAREHLWPASIVSLKQFDRCHFSSPWTWMRRRFFFPPLSSLFSFSLFFICCSVGWDPLGFRDQRANIFCYPKRKKEKRQLCVCVRVLVGGKELREKESKKKKKKREMYSNSYSSYKGGRIPSSLSGVGSGSSYSSSRYGIRSSSSVPYGVTSPSYSVPLSSSTLSALALSSTTSSRYVPSKSSSAYSPASSASSSPRLSSFYNPGSAGSGGGSHHPTSSLTYSRSFNRGSDGYGSWSVSWSRASSGPNRFRPFASCVVSLCLPLEIQLSLNFLAVGHNMTQKTFECFFFFSSYQKGI